MTEKINKINNPLTIIAIFAALAEINATIAIGLIDEKLHGIFIWFIIGFPTLLVISFFLTLNFNTKVMYSPSDYKDDKSFMDSLFNNYGNKRYKKITNEIINPISEELEQKITEKITERLISSKKDNESKFTDNDIEELKLNIKEATDETIQEIRTKSLLSIELKEKMLNYFTYPAYYLLINALVRSKAHNFSQLKDNNHKFYIPRNWEGGIERLLLDEILIGNKSSFSINNNFVSELESWCKVNDVFIKSISRLFKMSETTMYVRNKQINRSRINSLVTELIF